MANYTTIQRGSQGGDTTKWQKFLRASGYDVAIDGIFGDETHKATMEYQRAHGLGVDGIVGKETWGKYGDYEKQLFSTPSTSGTGKNTATNTDGTVGTGFNYKDFSYKDFNYDKTYTPPEDFKYDDFQYGAYKESETVAAANAALEAQLAKKPGEYKSQWQSQLDEAINKILNREKFSYDLNGDALYQQYKDKYIQQGKMAMADTMGQAAAMTGGYGNSYAASVGNQAYQQSLQQLNDVVPELYQMAYDRYNQEGQDMYNQYAMLGERENMDYGRYRDSVSDWMAERDYLTGRYDSERNFDYSKYTDDRNFQYGKYADDRNFQYGKYADDRNFEYGKYIDDRNYEYDKYVNDRNFEYGKYADDRSYAYNDYRNQIEDSQWQATFDEGVRQYNEQFEYGKERDKVEDSQWQATFDEGVRQFDEGVRQFDEQFEYGKERDKVEDDQWQKEFEEKYGAPVLEEGSEEYWNNYNSKYESGSFNNGTLTQDQIKQLQKALGVTADGLYGEKSKKAAGGLSAEDAYKKFFGGGKPQEETGDDYADWDATDWEGYFATIRNTKGKAAAQEELNRMTNAGLIPQNMVPYAGIGARGSLGH